VRTRLVLATVPVALLGVALAPSFAAPKKPIEKTYAASAPVPGGYVTCDGSVPMAAQLDEFKVPAAGTLKIELTDFVGDWDLYLYSGGTELASSFQIQPLSEGELISHKFKKATTVQISACNMNGGPDGTVKLKFTYA
jgi:hypothetical protein